jgi:hypothetical protein
MLDDAIEELTKIYIQQHFKKENKKYIVSKEELMQFCIKLVKVIKRVEDGNEIL